jgi:DNA-binding beta-propeller fold protein YncE
MRSAAIMGAIGAVVAAGATGALAARDAAPASPSYKVVGTFGKPGTAPGQVGPNTAGIATDKAGNVYVSDADNRVEVFSAAGKFLRTWGSAGSENGQFDVAEDVAVSPDGTIWVADAQNGRLQQFSAAGAFLASIAVPVGDLPRGIAVDNDGNVLVAVETSHGSLLKYVKGASGWEQSGGEFGGGDYRIDDVEVSPDGTIFTATARSQLPFEQAIRHYSADGQALGSFKTPDLNLGIGIDLDCNVWGANRSQRQIVKYSPSGKILATATSPDLVANDVAIGPKGDLYVIHQATAVVHFGENRARPATALVPARLTAARKVVKVKYTLTGVACPAQLDANASLTGKGIAGKATVKVAAGKSTVISIPLAKAASGPAKFTIVLKTNGRPTTQTAAVSLTAR